MLVEIHMLQNHCPSNMNRDDLGAPKTAMFGGFLRARISSQCIKRSIRDPRENRRSILSELLQEYIGRSTRTLPEIVRTKLGTCKRIPEEYHEKIVDACKRIAKAEKDGQEQKAEKEDRTKQMIRLRPMEAERFLDALAELFENNKPDFLAFLDAPCPNKPSSYTEFLSGRASIGHAVDIALFGRMTTSRCFKDVEASMQVAHAISTHDIVPGVDYFTAVDDLIKEAGLIQEAQLTSATFYKYFCLDWEGFLSNLKTGKTPTEAERILAGVALKLFIKAAACTVPTGKKNAFAHNNLPDFIFVEVKKDKVPTNYANAFLFPVKPVVDKDGNHSLMDESIRQLDSYVQSTRTAFEIESEYRWFLNKLRSDCQPAAKTNEAATSSGPTNAASRNAFSTGQQVNTITELAEFVLSKLHVPVEGDDEMQITKSVAGWIVSVNNKIKELSPKIKELSPKEEAPNAK